MAKHKDQSTTASIRNSPGSVGESKNSERRSPIDEVAEKIDKTLLQAHRRLDEAKQQCYTGFLGGIAPIADDTFLTVSALYVLLDEAFGGQMFLPALGPTDPRNVERGQAYLDLDSKVADLYFATIELLLLADHLQKAAVADVIAGRLPTQKKSATMMKPRRRAPIILTPARRAYLKRRARKKQSKQAAVTKRSH